MLRIDVKYFCSLYKYYTHISICLSSTAISLPASIVSIDVRKWVCTTSLTVRVRLYVHDCDWEEERKIHRSKGRRTEQLFDFRIRIRGNWMLSHISSITFKQYVCNKYVHIHMKKERYLPSNYLNEQMNTWIYSENKGECETLAVMQSI